MTTPTSGPTTSSRLAHWGTHGLDPRTWIIADTLLIGWHTDRFTGVLWGLLGCLFAAVIPMAVVKVYVRRGQLSDKYVGERRQRPLVLSLIALSVAAGIGLMLGLGAPATMTALIAAMLITLAALLAISTKWKISIHAAVAAGSVAMLALTFGPWALLAFVLVAVVGVSRVQLKDHTLTQVAAGAVLGGAVAAGAFELLR